MSDYIDNSGGYLITDSKESLIICPNCKNTSFHIHAETVLDDARLYCTECLREL